MDEHTPIKKRRGCWTVGFSVLGVLFVLTLLTSLWVSSVASDRWAAFSARLDGEIAALKAETGARTPLLGPAVPGNAWDDYTPAMEIIPKALKTGKVDASILSKAVTERSNTD